MELNFSNIKFSNAYDIIFTLLCIIAPPIVFLAIYDFNLFQKIEILKVILLGVCAGMLLTIVNALIIAIVVGIFDALSDEKKVNKKDEPVDDNDIGNENSAAVFFTTLTTAIVIGNLINKKYFHIVQKSLWIKSSIKTALFMEGSILLLTLLLFIAIVIFKIYRWYRQKKNLQ